MWVCNVLIRIRVLGRIIQQRVFYNSSRVNLDVLAEVRIHPLVYSAFSI